MSKIITELPNSDGLVNKKSITQLAVDRQTSRGPSQSSSLY
jgi:hypothetical protein